MKSLVILLGVLGILSIAFFMILASPEDPAQVADDDKVNVTNTDEGLPEDTPLSQIDLNQRRLHPVKRRYYKVGETGPCNGNSNMRFFAVPDKEDLGQCDCDWFECSRPLLFHNQTEKCYWAWSRGPCEDGEWYVFGEKMTPICQKHPCPEFPMTEEGTLQFYFQNPQDQKCYQAGSKGYCQNEVEILGIFPNEPIPVCRNYTLCNPLSIPVQQICAQGNRRHFDGFCSF